MTLATFNITKALDEHGNVIEPELKWMSGTIRYEIGFSSLPRVFLTRFFKKSPQAVWMPDRASICTEGGIGQTRG